MKRYFSLSAFYNKKMFLTKLTLILSVTLLWIQPAYVYSEQPVNKQSTLKQIEENDPIPFSDYPSKQEWRMGFRGYDYIYFLELQPYDKETCKEKDVLLHDARNRYGLPPYYPFTVSLSFSNANKLKSSKILNPKEWTIIDINGFAQQMSFTQLAAFYDDTGCGCWYMGSKSLREKKQVFSPVNLINDHNIVFGIAGKIKKAPKVRRPITNQTDDPYFLPNSHKTLLSLPELKNHLGKDYDTFKKSAKLDYGNSIKAVIQKGKQPEVLWLFQWITEENDLNELTVWGIFNFKNGKLTPLFLSKSTVNTDYDNRYSAIFIAAIDLDSDGIDELVTRVTYDEGNAYKVFSLKDNKLKDIFTSFYYGL